MKDHQKKMIAPIIITAVFVLYFTLYFALIIFIVPSIVLKAMLGVIPALLGAAMIWVCVQRIKEIKGGEEDDLGKY